MCAGVPVSNGSDASSSGGLYVCRRVTFGILKAVGQSGGPRQFRQRRVVLHERFQKRSRQFEIEATFIVRLGLSRLFQVSVDRRAIFVGSRHSAAPIA